MTTSRIPHTCPKVERIMQGIKDKLEEALNSAVDEAESDIKDQVTYPFRAALDQCQEELEEAQNNGDAEYRAEEAENRVKALEEYIEQIRHKLLMSHSIVMDTLVDTQTLQMVFEG